uniref:Uncharacterized protein n=1 Tax=Anguilla anguilla TaxID=7936 RepID=A0A0E9QDC1_ANGAN
MPVRFRTPRSRPVTATHREITRHH